MSRNLVSPLHIEWTPTWVRAVNIATGESAQAASISELGSILNGQRQALVGVGHNHVFLKSLRLPKAEPDDLRNILGVQIGQLFPLPPEDLSFDFIQTADRTADGMLTVVGAIRSEDIRRIRAELKQVGIAPLRILPIALAAAPVALRAGAADGLVVQNGAGGLSLDVVQEGILRFSRVAAAGSDPAVEAQRTLAAARSGSLPTITVGLVEVPTAIPSLDTELALLHDAPHFDFELSEDRVRETKKRIADRTRLAILFMLAALAFVLLVFYDRQDAQAKVTRSEGKWARIITTQTAIKNDETSKAAKIVTVQNTLDQAFKPAQPLSDIAAVVGDNLPPGAWITGLMLQRGKPIEVRGTAKTSADVTQLVNKLGTNPRFRDVRLVFANSATISEVPVVQFNISAMPIGNLPMPVPQKPGRSGAGVTTTTTTTATGTGAAQ